MRVFVWASYGNSSVYYADTPEDLRKIFTEVRDALRDFYSPEEFVELFGPEPDLLTKITERKVMELIEVFGGFSVHDTFNYGTEFTTVLGR